MAIDDTMPSGGTSGMPDSIQERAGHTAVTQEEIDDVLNDERLSDAEREARLADLRQRILDDDEARDDEAYAPLQFQIMNALSMLAGGGHDYDNHLRVEGEESDEPAIAQPGSRPIED